jgi:hypothetical protein
MMGIRTLALPVPLAAVVAAAVFGSCGSDRTTAPRVGLGTEAYLDLSRPENVIENLQRAYRNRDIDAFEVLLAPEFVFRFQTGDAPRSGQVSWGYEEEVASTRNLFESKRVKEIEIRLEVREAVPATEPGLEHTMLVRVAYTSLRVTEQDGTVLQVQGDRQDFFLRRGDGDHSDRWQIVEWRDLPGEPGTAGRSQGTSGGLSGNKCS